MKRREKCVTVYNQIKILTLTCKVDLAGTEHNDSSIDSVIVSFNCKVRVLVFLILVIKTELLVKLATMENATVVPPRVQMESFAAMEYVQVCIMSLKSYNSIINENKLHVIEEINY